MTLHAPCRVTVDYPDGSREVYVGVTVEQTVTEPKDAPKSEEGSVRYARALLPEANRVQRSATSQAVT